MTTALLITGAIRDGTEFRWILDHSISLRQAGRIDSIVFSTWKGEVDRVSDLRKLIEKAGIILVESDMPVRTAHLNPKANGHIFFQKAALYYGLQGVTPGSFVIKARTDFIKERLESCMATLLKKNRIAVTSVPGLTQPIRTPLFTYDARVEWPFYWDDIVFTGMREELLEMCDFNSKYDVIFDPADSPAEVRFFAGRFLKHYPILEYGFANWKLPEVAKLLQKWASHDGSTLGDLPILLQSWLEAQFHILTRYLVLPDGVKDSGWLSKIRLRDFFIGKADGGISPFSYPWECHKICSQRVLNFLKDPTLPIEDRELLVLRNRLVAQDSDPSIRGQLPGTWELPNAEAEVRRFAEDYGIQPYRAERSQITIVKEVSEVSFEGLEIPDRKQLTWFQQKKLGVKKLAEKKFFQWISMENKIN